MIRLYREQQSKTIEKLSNQLLIEQCKQQNRKAQMALYRQYCDGMFIVARRYLKDDSEAEDAMQEAFIKAFLKLDQFKGDVTFGSWLKRIVINKCLDVIKRKKIQSFSLDEKPIEIIQENDWGVPSDVHLDGIIDAINNLRNPYRIVVQLYLLEGYDHQEISEIVDITENTSRTHLYRGKKQLQKQLKHLQYGTGY